MGCAQRTVCPATMRAKAVAGHKDVFVVGGGQIIRQSLDAGLVDELVLHLSPVVLGAGTPLFLDAVRRELLQCRYAPPAPPSTSSTTCASRPPAPRIPATFAHGTGPGRGPVPNG
jgi:dihydrofolate reductase